jgi:hypothetical protein
MIALPVEADDEHGASVAIAGGLIGSEYGRVPALRRDVANALTKAAVAKFVGATKKFDGIVGTVRGQNGFHCAVVLIAKGQNVRPHAKVSVTPLIIEALNHSSIELLISEINDALTQ